MDAIVTLHLAYSPSLECIDAIAETMLPLIILDTTPVYDFGPGQAMEEINYNHGIHGVQDMCNLLVRRNRQFFLEAGHWKESDVLDRIVKCVRAAKLASTMRNSRVGRIGNYFCGMGDFCVSIEELKSTTGIETVLYDFEMSRELLCEVSEHEVMSEMEKDRIDFFCDGISEEVHRKTANRHALPYAGGLKKKN